MKLTKETTIAVTSRLCRKRGCDRTGDHSRGLCEPCYRATAKYVAERVTTWSRLEAQGKVLERKPTLKDWLLS